MSQSVIKSKENARKQTHLMTRDGCRKEENDEVRLSFGASLQVRVTDVTARD
jgi:hypothetical protein